MTARLINFSILVGALLLCGCNSYQLGPPVNLPFKTVYVAPIKNKSFAPQAHSTLTNQLANAFLSEGVLTLHTKDKANATLSVVVDKYDRGISATDETDSQLARSISASLSAKATLIDNRTGKVYFRDIAFSTSATVYDNAGFQQAEYQVMPILARDLSRKIHQYVISMW